jgi:hypothetical protein
MDSLKGWVFEEYHIKVGGLYSEIKVGNGRFLVWSGCPLTAILKSGNRIN